MRDQNPQQAESGFDRLRLDHSTKAAAAALGLGIAGQVRATTITLTTSISASSSGFFTSVGAVAYSNIWNTTVSSSAYGMSDARTTVSAPNRFDAFDGFAGIFVDGAPFNQPGGMVDLTTTADGSFLTTLTPVPFANGIDASLDYFFDLSSPTMRVFATFTNNDASMHTVAVQYGGGLGSDQDTTIEDTSSGDATFDQPIDRWMITSDGAMDHDPVLTFVRFGPGGQVPSSTPDVPSIGFKDNYNEVWQLQLDPGETESLMMFVQFHNSVSSAQLETSDFGTVASLQSAGLTAGLSNNQLDLTVNWVPEPGSTLMMGAALLTLAAIRRWST